MSSSRLALSRRRLLMGSVAAAGLAGAPVLAQEFLVPLPRTGDAAADHKLWYRNAAETWVEALPIGNGRLGAMVFGGVARERLQLNEDTLWAGGPYDPSSPDALAALPEIRRLVFEGKYLDAQNMAQARMMGKPIRQMSYQTIGDLMLSFGLSSAAAAYRRELDLDQAIATTEYRQNGVTYRRELLASHADDVIVVRLTADKAGAVTFEASFETPQSGAVAIEDQDLVLTGANGSQFDIPAQLKFETRVRVVAKGGRTLPDRQSLRVEEADEALLIIAMATSYVGPKDVSGDPRALTLATLSKIEPDFERLKARHLADYQPLFRRVDFAVGATDAALLPTDQRVTKSQTLDDPALAALYFQYGRYLLLSCSRPGTQPANLQGLWNDKTSPPWGSKYTININTEMNYWPAEPLAMQECVEPLIAMVKQMAITGAVTARVNYGARGWVCHHNTDLWRATAPIDGARFGLWPMGGAWLCEHLWDHYDYGRDKAYLAEVYPVMKGAAQFFLDTLVEHPDGSGLVTCPSMSPENLHPFGASTCAGPAMDSQILRDLFAHVAEASQILRKDAGFRREVLAARARLPADRIGKAGQLQEWLQDWDMEAPEPHHRHVSHLYALFPSWQISMRDTPDLARAAQKSLDLRGDLSTGWAIGWRINLWARLGDGDRTHRILKLLLDPSRTYPNLFDAHPPFQIDGNFGGTNGMAEMIVQSRPGEIEILPALPSVWPKGWLKGVRARGGLSLDLEWADGKPTSLRLKGPPGAQTRVRYGQSVQDARIPETGELQIRV
ncbi:glycoside hydrolase family 95 protein [Brevundimonas intermedia]|uniref:glycoside hydrolase family 95 protein n=1 Tax=Brevundimonas intermedia TaxID=74315 RepID=UPI00320844EB